MARQQGKGEKGTPASSRSRGWGKLDWVLLLVTIGICLAGVVRYSTRPYQSAAAPDVPPIRRALGTNAIVALDYYALSSCPSCASETVRTAVAELVTVADSIAKKADVGLERRAVAIGYGLEGELEYLRSITGWHQVSLGSSWYNVAMEDNLWARGLTPAVPQVALYQQCVEVREPFVVDIREERLVRTWVGQYRLANAVEELRENASAWFNSGRICDS